MTSKVRRNAALALGIPGLGSIIGVLLFASDGSVVCLSGIYVTNAECVAEYWAFGVEGALVPLLAAVCSVAILAWLRPRLTLKLLATAVPGAAAGIAAWLLTRSGTLTRSTLGGTITVPLAPTPQAAVCWAVAGALVAIAATAIHVHGLRGGARA